MLGVKSMHQDINQDIKLGIIEADSIARSGIELKFE
jgi:hypothetical protein